MDAKGMDRFRMLFEQSVDGILVFNSERRVIDVNTSGCNMFRFSKDEMLQLSIFDVLSAEDIQRISVPLTALAKGSMMKDTWNLRCKNNSTFIADVSVMRFNDGQFQAIIKDSTEIFHEKEALKRLDERYRLTLDSLLEGCQIIDFGWRYVYLNRSAEIHNRKPNLDLLGKRYQEIWPGIEHTEVYNYIKMVMDQRISLHLENEFIFPDGNSGWFDLSIQPVPEGVFILSFDITERKKAEKALRNSEEKYRLVIDNTSEWIYWLTPEKKLNYISPACEKITGYPPDDFIADPNLSINITHPEDKSLMLEHFSESWDADKPENLNFRIITKAGEIRWLHHSCRPIYDDNGKFLGRRAVNRDITELKIKEEELHESEVRFSKLYEKSSLGMAIVGSDFKIKAANPAHITMFGYSEEELKEKTFIDITYPDDAVKDIDQILQLINNEIQVFKTEKRYVRKNGEMFWGSLTVTANFSSDGKHLYNVAIIEDITERKEMEQALRDSEEKFREIFRINPDAIYITRFHDGMYLAVSNAFCQIFECCEEDVLGKTSVELNLWANVAEREVLLKAFELKGSVENIECKMVTFKQNVIDVLVSATILTIDGVKCQLSTIKNISDLKNNLQAIQKKDALLNEVGRIAKIGGWEFSPITGIASWTEEVARIHDLDPNTPGSVELSLGFYPEKSRRIIEKAFQDLVEQAKPYDFELNFVSAKGVHKWIRTIGQPILENGNVVKVHGAFQDITAFKKSEEIIKLSEAKLNFAQSIAKMGSWEMNMISHKQTWSENNYVLLGFKPYEIEPKYEIFFSLIHPDDRYLITKGLVEIIHTKSSISLEFRYLLKDGTILWVQNNMIPHFEGDELVALSGVNIDITDKKIAEKQLIEAKEKIEASDRLKSSFINNISHEIRTPINGILGFAQLLIDPYFSNEDKQEYYFLMNESCDRLLNTITNIMDISLLSTRNQKLVWEEIDVEKCFNLLESDFRNTYSRKKIEFNIHVEDSFQTIKLFTDINLLSKILTQLIDNALKFTSNGSITLSAEVQGNEALLSVTDTGIGISEEHRDHIFHNFSQVDNTTTRKYEGMGLGLSIAKGYTELLGGRMRLESEKGIGTKFIVALKINER